MHHRPRDARAETICCIDRTVASGRDLVGAGDLVVDGLRRVVDRYPVELFAFVVHAQGYRLLIRALDDRVGPVVRDLQSHVARALNIRQGRRGSLWSTARADRSMRTHPETVSTLVDMLLDPVNRGEVGHPADHALPSSYSTLVDGRSDALPHTVLPWFGLVDDAELARRLGGMISARCAAVHAWSMAGRPSEAAPIRAVNRRRNGVDAIRLVRAEALSAS